MLSGRHVSSVRISDCRILRILPHFSHISATCPYLLFSPHKLAFSTTILISFAFLLSISIIRFRYLDHMVANRMAPSMCLDPCAWNEMGSWFQAILYHLPAYFRRVFGIYAIRIFLVKMSHKTDTPNSLSWHQKSSLPL